MKKMVEERGLQDQIYIESAAHSAEEIGNPVYPPAKKELAKHGISCDGKRARQIVRTDYDRWDLIIAMEKLNLGYMARILGDDYEGKIHLLMEYAGTSEDIDDPWYTGDFEGVYAQIERGCKGLIKYLSDQSLITLNK